MSGTDTSSVSPVSADSWEAAASDPATVLARLRTDLPDAAILPTPPPVPRFEGDFADFSLRIAEPAANASGDAQLVADWMSRPHLVDTWEQPWDARQWAADWEAKLRTTYALPLILSLRGEEVGYMEIYRPLRDEIGRVFAPRPHDLGLHIAVGDVALTGKGIVGPLLGACPRALAAADQECELVVADPDYRNYPMHRVLSREGWTDCGERQQRADRRVRLFAWSADAAVLAERAATSEDA